MGLKKTIPIPVCCLLDPLWVVAVWRDGAELPAAGRLDGLLPAAGHSEAGGPAVAGHQALARAGVARALVTPRHALVVLVGQAVLVL